MNKDKKFNEIFELYKDDIFHLIFSYTLNVQDTKDILQETFIKYYTKMNTISSENKQIKSWLMKVAVNQTKDNLKNIWKRKIKALEHEDISYSNNDYDMLEIITNLSKKYRLPIYLYYYEGYNIEEISQILTISVSAVKMRLSRAKEQLKKEMEKI